MWWVVQGHDVASYSTSHQRDVGGVGEESAAADNPEIAMDAVCSAIFEGLGRGCTCIRNELSAESWERVEFLHERYSARNKFKKATIHTTLAIWENKCQTMYELIAKKELCSVQLNLMDGPLDEGLLIEMFVKPFSRSCETPHCAIFSAVHT